MRKTTLVIIGGVFMLGIGALVAVSAFVAINRCEDIVDSNQEIRIRVNEGIEAITVEDCLGLDQDSPDVGGSPGSPGASPPGGGLQNGRLPFSALEVVSSHGDYQCMLAAYNGAASSWRELMGAAQADGWDIEGGWCYRTYEAQEAAWNSRRCYVAGNCDGNPFPPTARPGTSNHGWGLAVDVWNRWDSILSCSDPEFIWMQLNAPRFGWEHPGWARCGQGSQEPWHWEYVG